MSAMSQGYATPVAWPSLQAQSQTTAGFGFRYGPVIGNSVMSLASLLSMSPIGAVFSHIAMHTAAVLHGIETTVQLPPHYPV